MSESEPSSVTNQIRKAASGDRDAAAWLWERYRRLLYALAGDHRGATPRSGAVDTSDVVAEAGIRFLDAALFVDVRDRKHFHARLRQVISGKAIDFYRRESIRRTELLHEDAQGPIRDDVAFLNAEMDDLLEQLPLTLHKTVLTFLECGNEREAADRLEISRYELRIRLDQIRGELRKHLEGDDEP